LENLRLFGAVSTTPQPLNPDPAVAHVGAATKEFARPFSYHLPNGRSDFPPCMIMVEENAPHHHPILWLIISLLQRTKFRTDARFELSKMRKI
jgi:hypothetical protein